MTSTTISVRVDPAERREIAARAERDKVSLSDYIRVRLGLRADGFADSAAEDHGAMPEQLADHERRLVALEARRDALAPAARAAGGQTGGP